MVGDNFAFYDHGIVTYIPEGVVVAIAAAAGLVPPPLTAATLML